MHRSPTAPTLLALLAAWLLMAPTGAEAQDREFTGRVERVGKKSIVVDRQGDKITFERTDGTAIEDASGGRERKQQWKDLKRDDRVSVKWQLGDAPKKAHGVIVLPKGKGRGKDERDR